MRVFQSTKFWSCIDVNNLTDNDAWGCHVVLTLGFLSALAITVPMGYFNLDDNMIIQQGAFVLTLGCWGVWILACFFADPAGQIADVTNATPGQGTWTIPMVNSDPNFGSQAGVLGTILFNFGFVTTIPSWVNEKKPSVSVNKTVWLSSFLCILIFFAIGIPGAMGFKYFLAGPASNTCAAALDDPVNGVCHQNLMGILTDAATAPAAFYNHPASKNLLAFSVYLFPIVAILSSIPVFSIVIKYNCIENGFSKTFGTVWGVLFPWIVAAPLLYQPTGLNSLINFSSLFFVSFTDFVVPWCLYIIMNQRERADEANAQPHMNVQDSEKGTYDDEIPDANEQTGLLFDRNVPEHIAIPESWEWTNSTKIQVASVLVIVMTGLSLTGTGLSIAQGASSDFTCALVAP